MTNRKTDVVDEIEDIVEHAWRSLSKGNIPVLTAHGVKTFEDAAEEIQSLRVSNLELRRRLNVEDR